jgi:hypothetical protein
MRRIAWVPHPDETYRSLCATIFGPGGVALPAHLRPAAAASPVESGPDALPPFFPPTGAPHRGEAPATAVQYSAGPSSTGPETVLPYRAVRRGRGPRALEPGVGAGDGHPAVWTARDKPPPHPH